MISRSGLLIALCAVASLTSAAAAQERHMSLLGFETGQLAYREMEAVLKGGTALCLLHGNDPISFHGELERRAFDVSQGEMGDTTLIEAIRDDAYLTLYFETDTGDFASCVVEYERALGPDSDQAVGELLEAVGWPDWTRSEDGGCTNFEHPVGTSIFIDSGGNDPNCETLSSSAITVALASTQSPGAEEANK